MRNLSPITSTCFHSCVPKSEKNLTERCPGWPLMPGVTLVPGSPNLPRTPRIPGTPLTNPSHLPIQMPQSLLPRIRIALSPAFWSRVQHLSGLLSCSLLGSASPRMTCAVLTTFPTLSITSAEEKSSFAECIIRQVKASRWL